MKKLLLRILTVVSLVGNSCWSQYCTAVGPYYTDYSYMTSFTLSGESGTSISYSSPCPGVLYLNDQTLAETVTLDAGTIYSSNAGFSTCSFGSPGVGQGWIDYNQNQVFEPSESIGTWSGTPPVAPAVWNFMVPATAINGTTRMRVMQVESGFLPLNPCTYFWYGSAVDFTVQIIGGVDCSGYIGQNIDEPRVVSALPYAESHSNAVCYFNNFASYQSPDVFYRVIPDELGLDYFTVSLCGSSFDTYLTVVDQDTNVIAVNDDFALCSPHSELTIAAELADTFYVIVQGWGNFSGNYSLSITEELSGISSNSVEHISILPNPATSTIVISDSFSGRLDLFDPLGRLVFYSDEVDENDLIDISTLPAGVYMAKIFSGNSESTIKLIKQ